MATSRTSSRGFTLVELLVVVAVLAILVAMLLPVMHKVRESAISTHCLGNLRQCGIGMRLYGTNYGMTVPASYSYKNVSGYSDQYYIGFYDGRIKAPQYIAPQALGCPRQQYSESKWATISGGFRTTEKVSRNSVYGMVGLPGGTFNLRDREFYHSVQREGGPFNFFRLSNMRGGIASDYLFMGCTSAASGAGFERANLGCPQFVARQAWSGGSWDSQALWMAHGTKSYAWVNALFADGHVEQCDEPRLLSTTNNWSTATPTLRGIRAYKNWHYKVIIK
jgi:prepilin-type N-terminal cleavage/methylation domain-containing protein/prepilin-type processing-associated H-X9-DG protein